MNEAIALAVHACVDWECDWDLERLTKLAAFYQAQNSELRYYYPITSERELLLTCLWLMRDGKGAELIPESEDDVKTFARRFPYRVTCGGTAARAAIALGQLGIPTVLQMCPANRTMLDLYPETIRAIPASGTLSDQIYPHVSISYPAGERIRAGDIDFMTPRENRILISRDTESLALQIDPAFAKQAENAGAFLESCFCEIVDFDILKETVGNCRRMLNDLPEKTVVVYEDGGYIRQDFRKYVNEQLRDCVDNVSMNEDELQDYTGRIDIRDPEQVLTAVRTVHEMLGVPVLFVHSSRFALACGAGASGYREVLESGITMASARFMYGDDFGPAEFKKAAGIRPTEDNIRFAAELERRDAQICCVPCKDMSFVSRPTVIGLGDYFAGGIVKALAGV